MWKNALWASVHYVITQTLQYHHVLQPVRALYIPKLQFPNCTKKIKLKKAVRHTVTQLPFCHNQAS